MAVAEVDDENHGGHVAGPLDEVGEAEVAQPVPRQLQRLLEHVDEREAHDQQLGDLRHEAPPHPGVRLDVPARRDRAVPFVLRHVQEVLQRVLRHVIPPLRCGQYLTRTVGRRRAEREEGDGGDEEEVEEEDGEVDVAAQPVPLVPHQRHAERVSEEALERICCRQCGSGSIL